MDTQHRTFWTVVGIVVLIATFEAFAQTLLKKAQVNKKTHMILFGVIMYFLVGILLFVSYHYEGLGHINLLWSCLSIIIAILVGYTIFGEPVNHFTWVAFGCALGAIYFAHKAGEFEKMKS